MDGQPTPAAGRSPAALVECVPNFSEGRDRHVVDALASALDGVAGARVLHVDPGAAAHRTVITLAGDPEAVLEAAFRGVAEAVRRIDLRGHDGVHPRLGAADVVPFVPLEGATLADCAALARRLGQRVGDALGVPVYLYGAAARDPGRASLARLRRGQAEALPRKLARLPPDYGPCAWAPGLARAGASVIGARPVLVAWNVTLASDDLALARAIAARVRATAPGGLPAVRAIGWRIAEYGAVQVSTNLLDWRRTPPAAVTEAVRRLASEAGVAVAGSELVGLAPEAALLAPAPDQDPAPDLSAAVGRLGLDHLGAFVLQERILERRLRWAGLG